MSKVQVLPNAKLSGITLSLDIEGHAWAGFTAERGVSRTYSPDDWPGMRKAIAALCEWGGCEQNTVRPVYGQLQWNLRNEHGHMQHLVRELEFSQ